MREKPLSWKQKIDPAADKIIRYYLRILDQIELPVHTGWLTLDKDSLKMLEQKEMHGWTNHYEEYLSLEAFFIKRPLAQQESSGKESDAHLDDFKHWLSHEIKSLPKESREFYKKRLAPFYSQKAMREYLQDRTEEQIQELFRELVNDMLMLELHKIFVGTGKAEEKKTEEALQKRFNKPAMLMESLIAIHNALSLVVFKVPLYQLMKDAMEGDTRAFFRLLQIDKTAVEFEWARKMIRKAQLASDKKFFRNMAKALAADPIRKKKITGQALLLILLFWKFGLHRLDNDEVFELLESVGMKVEGGHDTFRKVLTKEIRPLFPGTTCLSV